MNYYCIKGDTVKTRAELKALFLLYLTSLDFDVTYQGDLNFSTGTIETGLVTTTVPQFNVNGHLPYSLGNLNYDTKQVLNPVYSSEFQQTQEGFDKPIVETGDIVLVATDGSSDIDMGQYFDDFIKLDLGWSINNSTPGTSNIYIGTSNSSKSDFHTPFKDADHVIVTSQSMLGDLLINTDF